MKNYVIIDIEGPDASGTDTQIKGIISTLLANSMLYWDLRTGTYERFFFSQHISEFQDYSSYSEFEEDLRISEARKDRVARLMAKMQAGFNLGTGNTLSRKNAKLTYIFDPSDIQAFIFEEPSKTDLGRIIRDNLFRAKESGIRVSPRDAAALFSSDRLHSYYWKDAILRCASRSDPKVIINSRGIESSFAFQGYDAQHNPDGITPEEFFALPGHQLSYKYMPDAVIVVTCPPEVPDRKFMALFNERIKRRASPDDMEKAEWQAYINRRYNDKEGLMAWMDAARHGHDVPLTSAHYIDMRLSPGEIDSRIADILGREFTKKIIFDGFNPHLRCGGQQSE